MSLRTDRGFVLPATLFAMTILTIVAVAALANSGTDRRSSHAVREYMEAFYAAEAGASEAVANWNDAVALGIAPGGSVDLGWQTLPNGSSYRATIERYGDDVYGLIVEGKGSGAESGARELSLILSGGAGERYHLGECCDAAVTVNGLAEFGWDDYAPPPTLDGHDHVAPGMEDFCLGATNDKPGLLIADEDDFDNNSAGGWVDGVPPILEDPAITNDDWDNFGGLSYDDLKAMATHDLRWDSWTGPSSEGSVDADEIYPRYNVDGSCDTSHPFNWGSPDPDDACFLFHPIILIGRREFDIDEPAGAPAEWRAYGQGIIVLDWELGQASEFDFENIDFRGLILGRGCVEVQGNAIFRGAIFVNGAYPGGCGAEAAFKEENSADVWYSQCAIDRAIRFSGLEEFAVAEVPGGFQRLDSRAFHEPVR